MILGMKLYFSAPKKMLTYANHYESDVVGRRKSKRYLGNDKKY